MATGVRRGQGNGAAARVVGRLRTTRASNELKDVIVTFCNGAMSAAETAYEMLILIH